MATEEGGRREGQQQESGIRMRGDKTASRHVYIRVHVCVHTPPHTCTHTHTNHVCVWLMPESMEML
jgi:hypothetical protein